MLKTLIISRSLFILPPHGPIRSAQDYKKVTFIPLPLAAFPFPFQLPPALYPTSIRSYSFLRNESRISQSTIILHPSSFSPRPVIIPPSLS